VALKQQNSVFIDPENCGSSVGYYITIGEYHSTKTDKDVHSLSATVVLTDCNHKIDWGFSGNGEIDKIDSAISMLQEFRKKYIETEKLVAKLNK
jgi:transposase